jgi:hypothetical protein
MNTIEKKVFFDLLNEVVEPVKVSDIPIVLRKDIQTFLFGRTVTKVDDTIAILPSDYNDWIFKLKSTGLDYTIVLI